ncbi:hypothetical protein ACTXT7_008390 [Hymenolepis weldensis]
MSVYRGITIFQGRMNNGDAAINEKLTLGQFPMRLGKLFGSPRRGAVLFKASSVSGNALQLSGVMKCKAAFKGKTEATIDIFNVLEPKIQIVTCQQMRIKETMRRLAAVLEDTLGTCTRTIARGLNSLLEDNHHPLPVADTLFTILNGEKFFVKMELSDAYFQVKVELDGQHSSGAFLIQGTAFRNQNSTSYFSAHYGQYDIGAIYTSNEPHTVIVNIWLKKRSPSAFCKSFSAMANQINRHQMVGQTDGLSRLIDYQCSLNKETVAAFMLIKRDVQYILAESIRNTSVSSGDMGKKNLSSPSGLRFH